jgi:phosphoribosylformylglycinamidine synthase subunit PurL
MPTPTVGAVGVLADARRHATIAWSAGDEVLLVGGPPGGLGGSEYLSAIHGRTAGSPPALDLDLETRVQRVVRDLIAAGEVRTAHDCALGGLAVALAKMAIHSGIGVVADEALPAGAEGRRDEALFGEGASRIVLACPPASVGTVLSRCGEAGVPVVRLGRTGGDRFALDGAFDLSLDEVRAAFESALDAAGA